MKPCLGRGLVLSVLFVISILGSPGASAEPSPGSVTGTVFAQGGVVIPHVSIKLFSLDQLREVESDDHGKFAFTELPSGEYELQAAYPPLFETAVEDLKVGSDDIGPLSIILVSPGVPFHCGWRPPASYETRKLARVGLAGVVIDADGGPLPGAKVVVSELGNTHAVAKQDVDNMGNFQFIDLPPGKYTITASVKGHWGLQGEAFWITRGTLTRITLATFPNGRGPVCQ